MSFEKVKSKRFMVVGGGDIQFCPLCGVVLDEAIDHEVWKHLKNEEPVLTSKCPEKTKTSSTKLLFCPRCGEAISTKKEQKHTKHEIKTSIDAVNNKTTSAISCPLEKKTFDVIVSF